ncbi:MAG: ribosome biogenesis GTPase YlqF [Gammaproteobacteria bacterium]|nr:ribosome biogenesis GTPase YlqF [Gammaproteobacteria bacterium]
MAIQWFPGHMHKARKEIKQVMPKIDVIIEVLDARIPFSSENPLVEQLRDNKPCIKLLNKSDLADPQVTKRWLAFFEQEKNVKAQAVNFEQKAQIKKITELCRKLVPERNSATKPVRAMIMGIPNVGKSTIINILTGRTIARVGDEPAVTKRQQKIQLDNHVELNDTPGFLWPKIENVNSGYRLAITGAIKNTAMEFEDVALFAADYFLNAYADVIMARYKLKQRPENDIGLLEAIGRQRGCLQAGGVVNLHKVAEILLNEYRSNLIGRISLETPEMIIQEENLAVS